MPAADIAHRFSAFTPAGDERGYWERDAGILFPERCVAAQLQVARAHGADVRCGVSLHGIGGAARARDGVVTVETDAGPIEAAHVVLATGAWLPAMLCPMVRGRFAVQRQVLHWFPTDAPALYDPDHCPVFIWMHGDRGEAFYGFPNIGDHGTSIKVATEQSDRATTPEAVERHVSLEETAQMFDRHVRGRLRALRPQSVHDMTCLYTSTTDGRFVIDHHPELAHVTIVSACSGHGFKHSAALGEAVADDLLGRAPRVDISSVKTVLA